MIQSIEETAKEIASIFDGAIVESKSTDSMYIHVPKAGVVRISNHDTHRPERFNLAPMYAVTIERRGDGRYYTSTVEELILALKLAQRGKLSRMHF